MELGREKMVLKGEKMINNITKTISINGASEVGDNTIISAHASVSTGTVTINQTILNPKRYEENKEQCDKDMETFKCEVDKIINELTGARNND